VSPTLTVLGAVLLYLVGARLTVAVTWWKRRGEEPNREIMTIFALFWPLFAPMCALMIGGHWLWGLLVLSAAPSDEAAGGSDA
jgi:hypothetical protein